jgi:acyl dehydratase
MPFRHFEDFAVGETIVHGSQAVTAEDIVAFASEYDPQPFHLDPAAPETIIAGGLIASGWHVAAIFMRLMCDSFLLDSASLGSPGISTMKWLKPVRPGNVLSGRSTVLEARLSNSRPDMGIVGFRHETLDEHDEVVLWFENPILFGRRSS